MLIARCDKCNNKLDGVDGRSVYSLSIKASLVVDNEYEHLCEDCMDEINIDDEVLTIKQRKHDVWIDVVENET